MKVTSAYANKLIKQLQEEKDFLLNKEANQSTYIVTAGEDAVVPEYDFNENTTRINKIDYKIMNIRHAINYANATNKICVDDVFCADDVLTMTIDSALITMAQLNARKKVLDNMRKKQPKARVNNVYNNKSTEYIYANYNIADAQNEYDKVSSAITAIQLELDKYNQTVLFDIDD